MASLPLASNTSMVVVAGYHTNITSINKRTKENYTMEVDESITGAQSLVNQTTRELHKALMTCVDNILNRINDDVFISIYKDCFKGFEKRDDIQRCSLSGSSAEARKYRKQFNNLVKERLSDTIFETLLTNMDSKLKELEELKQDQLDTSYKWRPPGNACEHMVPFDLISKLEGKRLLEQLIEIEKESINLLKMRLIQKRSKVNELGDVIQSKITQIENAILVPPNEDASVTVGNE